MIKLLGLGLGIGLLAGLLGALCGVGGGIVMVPAFIYGLGLQPKQAIATSLAVIVVTALSASLSNIKSGLIDWRVAGVVAVAAVGAAWFGSELMRSLSNDQLTRIFGVVLIVIGIQMMFR